MKKKSTPIQDHEVQSNAVAQPQQKKAMKVLNIVINVVLVISIVLAAICTYVSFVNTSGNGVPSIFGLRLAINNTQHSVAYNCRFILRQACFTLSQAYIIYSVNMKIVNVKF